MKVVVLVLAMLAAGKIAWQEYVLRVAAIEAIVAAYRERALAACQRDAKLAGIAGTPGSAPEIRLVIGDSSIDVHLWQVDRAEWNARFKHPYLQILPGDRTSGLGCRYDIVQGSAMALRL